MSDVTILQGEDCDFELTMKKKDGTAINLSTAGVRVYAVVIDGYTNTIAKFKTGSVTSGWGTIDNTNLSTGLVKFSVKSDVTKTLKSGVYYVEVLMRFPSSIHTDDGFYDVSEKTDVFAVKESIINRLGTLPA